MTQSWRTLGAVALSAMVAGWLVARVLRPSPEVAHIDHALSEDADLPAAALPEPGRDTKRPAPAARQAVGIEDSQPARDRDLTALENALLRDRQVRDLLFSYPGIALLPSVIPYRRSMEFWQPAYAAAARSRR